MSDQSALVRQWILLKVLGVRGGGGQTVAELAREVGVSEKTIRRDLCTFSTVGFPIDESTGEHGRKSYRLESAWSHPDLAFTFDEALALYLGRKFIEPMAGTMVWEAAERAFRKIRASLGTNALRYLDRVGEAFHETTPGFCDYRHHAEILDSLLIGIDDRKVVWITYQSLRATEPVTYDIHPYRLTRHQGALYVVGLKVEDDQLRTWRVDRIQSARVDTMPFVLPPDLDLDAHFASSFGIYDGDDDLTVRVRISQDRARYVQEKTWHPSQQVQTNRDGSLIISFRLSNSIELKSWVLGFGADAEVLEPESLRSEIAKALETMIGIYETEEVCPTRATHAQS